METSITSIKKFNVGEEFFCSDCEENFKVGKFFNKVYADLVDLATSYSFDQDGLEEFFNSLRGGIWSDILESLNLEIDDVIVVDDYEQDMWGYVKEMAYVAWMDLYECGNE